MATNFVGEIKIFACNFAPISYAFCSGQLLSISQNSTLFTLIGTTYGGDGVNTFALPDFRGRLPISQGSGPGLTPRTLGEQGGTENVTLLTTQMPSHTHSLIANNVPGTIDTPTSVAMPSRAVQAVGGQSALLYTTAGTVPITFVAMLPQAVGVSGGSQPHTNIMPVLALNFVIALQGVFPSQN